MNHEQHNFLLCCVQLILLVFCCASLCCIVQFATLFLLLVDVFFQDRYLISMNEQGSMSHQDFHIFLLSTFCCRKYGLSYCRIVKVFETLSDFRKTRVAIACRIEHVGVGERQCV
jgi:hypothetical protein